ncbi:MAG: helix-turn-helix domain-containing protein [Slackia sp.]|nr:helix-turn-helix domain-containing protein [Slackia sp.]
MMYVYEFEFFENDGMVVAAPFELGEGTFGEDLKDAVESAADWMKEAIDAALIHRKRLPEAVFGHVPEHGGRIIAVAVECDLSMVDAVTAAEASRLLGVSTARVAQMCDAGLLESWREGAHRMVTRASVRARLEERPRAGRPRKQALKASFAEAAAEGADAAFALQA